MYRRCTGFVRRGTDVAQTVNRSCTAPSPPLLQVMRKDICRSKPLCLNKPAEDAILAYAQKVYGGRFHSLLTNLLQHSPARRPSAQQVRQEVRGFLRAESASAAADPHDLRRVAQELHVPESQLAEPWTHFQTADTQRQGAITVSQLKAVLTLLHIDISPQALMDRFDADGNGTMDFKEFATFWQQRDSVWMPTITPHRSGVCVVQLSCTGPLN